MHSYRSGPTVCKVSELSPGVLEANRNFPEGVVGSIFAAVPAGQHAASPLAQADSPLFKNLESPSVKDSPFFKDAPQGKQGKSPQGQNAATPAFQAASPFSQNLGSPSVKSSPLFADAPQGKQDKSPQGQNFATPTFQSSPEHKASPDAKQGATPDAQHGASPVAKADSPFFKSVQSPSVQASPFFADAPQCECSHSLVGATGLDIIIS